MESDQGSSSRKNPPSPTSSGGDDGARGKRVRIYDDDDEEEVEVVQVKEDKPKLSYEGEAPSSSSSSPAKVPMVLVLPLPRRKNCPVASGGAGSACESHGEAGTIGGRLKMEDAVAVAPGFITTPEGGYDFFGLYDGHGGPNVALACRDWLHVMLEEQVGAEVAGWPRGAVGRARWRAAMTECFAAVDAEVEEVEKAALPRSVMGSTAVTVVVGPRFIVVANCGDSRAVISLAGIAIPLSFDHKPERPDEFARVESLGGRIVNWDGLRVMGVLSVTRSIGDHPLRPYVISEPETLVLDRSENDEFIIIASDGLWDAVTDKCACDAARMCLVGGDDAHEYPDIVKGSTASQAAALLVEIATTRGSTDNISVVVIELKNMYGSAAI